MNGAVSFLMKCLGQEIEFKRAFLDIQFYNLTLIFCCFEQAI